MSNLPKLKKVSLNKPKKRKILLLSDDARLSSGIANASKEMILGTIDEFDWVQLGAAINHPDHGKIFDMSDSANEVVGIDHTYFMLYAHNGYGNPEVLRELLAIENPDAVMIFTDPRFWGWFFNMEHEIRQRIPVFYYNIWDAPPSPFWNAPFYASVDGLFNISKQTKALVNNVLSTGDIDVGVFDFDCSVPYDDSQVKFDSSLALKTVISYIPHGINPKLYYPITEESPDYREYKEFSSEFKANNDVDFIVFWNNRNIRRKNPGDVILAFKTFCDSLPTKAAQRCALLMHTQPVDENGTDLFEVKRVVCPDYKVIFSDQIVGQKFLNFYYNLADVTLNMSSNEGFGLSTAESIMAGTPIIVNVTGGLQDQCRFEDKDGKWIEFTNDFTSNHVASYKKSGSWVKTVFPANRSLQGSPMTPYIFDERCNFEDVARAIHYWYKLKPESRKQRGLEGRNWMLSEESGMSTPEMAKRFKRAFNFVFDNFTPRKRFSVYKMTNPTKPKAVGIVNQGEVYE